ncbi:MAG: UDP-N-acetylglucosamine 2-epimerase (non-hydrolyzing) [Candidatus Omnitrophota bacterium]
MKRKILCVFGTRPEAIKMAPVVKELQKRPKYFRPLVCVTAQHRHMLDQVLEIFDIKPDIDLNLMRKNQTLTSLTARSLTAITNTLIEEKPDLVLVQGDTTTAMVAALASFYQKIPVGHVEAGLRTNDKYNPFPEEINRSVIGVLAAYHFAPTRLSVNALKKCGIPSDAVYLTGNTVVDALQMILKRKSSFSLPLDLKNKKMILVTAHRRENFGRPLENICSALKAIASRNEDVEIVYPVHLNPNVRNVVYAKLQRVKGVHLLEPVEYIELVSLLKNCYLVLTDSGGIQEEAPALGKPVLVMRSETERPEGVQAGVARLVGTDIGRIIRSVEELLHNASSYQKMSQAVSPYGDGRSAARIVDIIEKNRKEGSK